MMYNNDFWEWECEAYRRQKTRNEKKLYRRYRTFFWIAVAVWAVLVIAIITTPVNSEEPPPPKVEQPEPEDDGRLPGDDIPASGYASIEAMPVRYIGEFTMTHYCPCERCCGIWADGITATGTTAQEGRTIAVDPSVIPYGSEVEIWYENGSKGSYIAEDCGGAIKGNRIDVYTNSHSVALERGIVRGSVFVVEDET